MKLTTMLEERNITIDTSGNTSFPTDRNVTNMTGYYGPETRIYFLNMYSIHARRLLCTVSINIEISLYILLGSLQSYVSTVDPVLT